MLKAYSIVLEEKQYKDIKNSTDNISEFVRESIRKNMNIDLSLEEILELIDKNSKQTEFLDDKLNSIIDSQLKDKKTLTIQKELELKSLQEKREQEEEDFIIRYNKLEELEEIQNFKFIDRWPESNNLMPILNKALEKEIRIGLNQLRRYLTIKSFKQHLASA